jgi:hypothetical protein
MYIDFGKKRGRLIFTWKEFLFVATAVAGFFANIAWTQIELWQVRQRADQCEKRLIDLEGKQKTQQGEKKMDRDIVGGVGFGLKLVPGLVLAFETLFGRNTGETKKKAVETVVQDAMVGATLGFGISGDTETAGLISGFAPVVSTAIDSIVDNWNLKGWPNVQQAKLPLMSPDVIPQAGAVPAGAQPIAGFHPPASDATGSV